jgi:subtilisin family serine protease
MAGVAAGSSVGNGLTYLGAAPGADIVVVKLKECKQYLRDFYLIPDNVPAYEENDVMLAVQYGDGFAVMFRRPVVFCIGLGTNYGDHAGSSALSRYLDAIAVKRSRAVVVCGGNEGNADHHFQGTLDDRSRGGTGNTLVEVRVGENAQGFLMELWGNVPDVFTISVRSPGGETIPPIRLGIQDAITYGFIYEKTKITIAGVLVEPASGEELITLRVQAPTAGIWSFQVEAAGEVHNGSFHLWLPITQFLNTQTYFLTPTPYITLTEPAMAEDVISVSTFDAAGNSFYAESGRGFSRTGVINPDFAAPGVGVSTIRGKKTGSSLAAAITAGAVAQFMQWAVVEGNNVVVESREIKNYFVRGASRNYDITYPNREWGYGRLNMVGTFDALIGV